MPSRTRSGSRGAMLGFAALASIALGSIREARAAVKVACIGEQTTHSDQFPATGVGEYPWMLQMRLGTAYDTQNFGDCCATVLQGYPKQAETHPYLMGKPYTLSLPFLADVVVIGSWGKHDTEIANSVYAGVLDPVKFQSDYDTLVTTYLNLASKPKVYLSLPVPIPKGAPQGVTTSVILPAVKVIADKYGLPIIDLYSSFLNHPELYKDDTHVSNTAGLQTISDLVYAAITAGDDAGAPGADGGGTHVSDAAAEGGPGGSAGSAGASGGGTSVATGAGGSVTTGSGAGGAVVGAGGASGSGTSAAGSVGLGGATTSDSGCACSLGAPVRSSTAGGIACIVVAWIGSRNRLRRPRPATMTPNHQRLGSQIRTPCPCGEATTTSRGPCSVRSPS
jgi:hypothetical protein